MRITVMSRNDCIELLSQWNPIELPAITEPTIVISITSMGDEMPTVQFEQDKKDQKNFLDYLCLQFDDVEDAKHGCVPIKEEDAKKIIEFVKNYKETAKQIIVHCDAGYSRSPAVAAALSLWLNGSDAIFFGPDYCPNRLVYRKILNALIDANLLA